MSIQQENLFGEVEKTEYQQFVEKFKPKLTTDDCYTPTAVYEWVLSYVKEQCNISDETRIMRPFRPNGDYQAEDYSGDCIVIDNPPFSIITKIVRWYEANNIRYFLFAPHLTLFNVATDLAITRIVADAHVEYENGAVVKTGFVSNLFGDWGVIADPTYQREIKRIQNNAKVALPKYRYPNNVVTVSRFAKMLNRGVGFRLKQDEIKQVGMLESQGRQNKGIFGSGYLIGDRRAEELRAEELRAEVTATIWELSPQEKEIIKKLDEA